MATADSVCGDSLLGHRWPLIVILPSGCGGRALWDLLSESSNTIPESSTLMICSSHRSHPWIQPDWVLGCNPWSGVGGNTNIQSLGVEIEYCQALTCHMLEMQMWKYMPIFICFPKERVARYWKKNKISLQNLHKLWPSSLS